jgi:predicted nucleic acid-binding Zn ribbon protein
MPTYLYICSNCGVTKQIVAELNEEIKVPYCGLCELDMVRRFGIQTIRFNGGGWGKDAR